jgi:hypothetical protein
MKKLLLILMLVPIFGISQARLGSTRNEIYNEFELYYPKFEISEDGLAYMHLETERSLLLYYFNNENLCNISVIAPKTQGDLNFFVEQYNNSYVIMGPTEWRMYSANGAISTIELVTHNGNTFFVWK